ncbi:MAG: gamma-glutamylcyclotransferase [Brevinematia bacterium]
MGELVFVFGTIRRSQPRHYLLGESNFVAEGIIEGFDLYYVNNMFPGIVEGNGKVFGEVYETDEKTLLKLDEAENVLKIKGRDFGLSKRVKLKVKTKDGRELDAWCYIFIQNIENSTKIESGDWVEFSKTLNR